MPWIPMASSTRPTRHPTNSANLNSLCEMFSDSTPSSSPIRIRMYPAMLNREYWSLLLDDSVLQRR